MRDTAFIVTKPLQILVALSIVKQLNIRNKAHLVIVDSFFNARLVYERMKSIDWEFSGLSFEFFESLREARKFARMCKINNLFIDADVGVQKYFYLLRMKFNNRLLNINVYEEGVGTYRTDLYSGVKKSILNLAGIGAHFGGCVLTSRIYLCEPQSYRKNFPNYKKPIEKLILGPTDIIRQYFSSLSHVFDHCSLAAPTSDICHIYLSSWHVDHHFLKEFSMLAGDKYLKLHPHIKVTDEWGQGTLVSRTAPAEMVLLDMMEKYKSVNVFHHGSSVEKYISGGNINFIKL